MLYRQRLRYIYGLIPILLLPILLACSLEGARLPVKSPKGYSVVDYFSVDTMISVDMLQSCITNGDETGLLLDLSNIKTLLDGTTVKPNHRFSGTLYLGPYPFESTETPYTYKRFRTELRFQENRVILPVGFFLEGFQNSEDWVDEGQLALRLHLYLNTEESVTFLGLYDTFVKFKREKKSGGKVVFIKQPTILEGPTVNMITSDDPSTMVISLETERAIKVRVVLQNGKEFTSHLKTRRHEIHVDGLSADTDYTYYVDLGEYRTKGYTFRTAPPTGSGEFSFAYCGDSRAGFGGGTNNLMGVNHNIMERLANIAYHKDARFFIFGGDLINGYTSIPEDFRTQMAAWKQATAGFRNHRPIYSCLGNHEALLRAFTDKTGGLLVLDRWPYKTESAEAVFAQQLVNPQNGPVPSDPDRPPYKETVYSFQYGSVRFICFNNNYWVARNLAHREGPWRTGGCPEGYILDDQMDWIEKELAKAETDETVKFIIMYAQEPVFPNGGHVTDAMWYDGSNAVRAYLRDHQDDKIKPLEKGIIDVRNHLVTLAGRNKKVAAVLGSDEHAYHKVLIDKNVPIGVPRLDDKDGSRIVCKEGGSCSALDSLIYPVWYLVCGGGGAPYYSRENAPWNRYWLDFKGTLPEHTSKRGCFYYSSQENFFLFSVSNEILSLKVYNPYGEVIDTIADMMNVKKTSK